MREVLLRILCIACITVPSYQQIDQQQFCERYVECAAVSTLEERLCLGNTRLRPYWLPERGDTHDCHAKLRNDYITLERLEEELDQELFTCLRQNTAQSATASRNCDMRTLQTASRFSYGRTINYVPTHCFTGVERRIERQCGPVRACCPALSRCSFVTTDSSLAKMVQDTRLQMRMRAENCRKGVSITPLPPPVGYNQRVGFNPSSSRSGYGNDEPTSSPGGYGNEIDQGGDQGGYESDNGESAYGNVNVNLTPKEAHDSEPPPEEDVGMISNPVPNREEFSRVYFRRNNNRGESTAQFTEEDGSLTLAAKPKLSFPDDGSKAISTKEGVLIVNVHQAEPPKHIGPQTVESHEKAFEHAMKNTNEYKAKMVEVKTGDTAREALNSLLRAGQAADGEKPVAVVSSGPIISGGIAPANPKASGSMRPLQTITDDDDEEHGEIVTSVPVIFVGNQNKVPHRTGCCIERVLRTQTQKLRQILAALGEKNDSQDMHEIKVLIDEWHNRFRKKVVSAKEKTTKLELSKALENLIKQFDRVNLDLIKSQVNATFDSSEYPDDDAEVFEKECDPLEVSELMEEEIRQQEKLEAERLAKERRLHRKNVTKQDEHEDRFIVEDGVNKLLVSGEDSLNVDHPSTSIEKDSKIADPTRDDAIIEQWSNDEYKRELEKYKKEHHINATSSGLRNETACDLYMRCRNQMHMAVDSCAWRFASSKILPSLVESAESLLYRAEELCDPAEQPFYEELYEMMIKRNTRLRDCLDKKNEKFFETSVCLPYSPVKHLMYGSAFIRLLSEDYKESSACFRDANLIQEKCTKLRECCPNFDSCRQETMDMTLEQAIISKTARMNEDKQNCLKSKAREAFKSTLRGLFGHGSRETMQKLKRGELNLDLQRGAQVLARLR